MVHLEDKKIVELFWKRIEQAITETNIKYGKLCRRIATNMLFNSEDAEEIVNDTYLGLWNAIPPNKPRYLMPFVCRITKNLAMGRLDYANAKKRNGFETLSFEELGDIVSGDSSVEEEYEIKEIAGYINEFIKRLPQKKQVLFVRRYWCYDSIKKIASELKMNEDTVKSELLRMRKKLKKYLEEKGVIL